MIPFNHSQKIISFICLAFLLGASYLFFVDARYRDPSNSKDWFSLYFTDPKSDKLSFTIENSTAGSDFRWEISTEKQKLSEGSVTVAPQKKKNIKVDPDEKNAGKITVRVTSGNETQEIYKNIGVAAPEPGQPSAE